MPTQNSLTNTEVYEAFKSLPPKGWMKVVRMYESEREAVAYLPASERMEVMGMYFEALHELGEYEGLCEGIDELVELSLSSEVPLEVGRLCYEEALFWKSNALLHLKDYEQSRRILLALQRMQASRGEPADDRYRRRISEILRKQRPDWMFLLRAFAISLALSAIVVSLMDILFIKSFYPHWHSVWIAIRNGMVVLSLSAFLLPLAYHRLRCFYRSRRVLP